MKISHNIVEQVRNEYPFSVFNLRLSYDCEMQFRSSQQIRLCFEAKNSNFICKLICSLCKQTKWDHFNHCPVTKKNWPLFSKEEPTLISSKRLQNHDINTTKLNLTEILMKTTVMKIVFKKYIINFYSLSEERDQEV